MYVTQQQHKNTRIQTITRSWAQHTFWAGTHTTPTMQTYADIALLLQIKYILFEHVYAIMEISTGAAFLECWHLNNMRMFTLFSRIETNMYMFIQKGHFNSFRHLATTTSIPLSTKNMHSLHNAFANKTITQFSRAAKILREICLFNGLLNCIVFIGSVSSTTTSCAGGERQYIYSKIKLDAFPLMGSNAFTRVCEIVSKRAGSTHFAWAHTNYDQQCACLVFQMFAGDERRD